MAGLEVLPRRSVVAAVRILGLCAGGISSVGEEGEPSLMGRDRRFVVPLPPWR
jgi:hypothetical protein